MELTREYFDQALATMATKDDLKAFATKVDLEDVAQTIVEAVGFSFDKVDKRLDKLETLIKPIRTDLYKVSETPPQPQRERLPSIEEKFLEIMARKGIKWPASKHSGQKT